MTQAVIPQQSNGLKVQNIVTDGEQYLSLINDIPSTLSKKYCTFGYGKKQFVSMAQERKMYELPAPGVYDHLGQLRARSQTFCREVRFGKKVRQDGPKPGPGSYNLSTSPGQYSKHFTLYQKLQPLKKPFESPSPNLYSPLMDISLPTRYKKVGFGYGKKMDFSFSYSRSPAPNAYIIKGKYDSVKNKRK